MEETNLELLAETLDKMDDMHLELLRRMPRSLRPLLTIRGIVNFSVNVVLMNYKTHGDESLIYKHMLLITNDLKQPPENLKAGQDEKGDQKRIPRAGKTKLKSHKYNHPFFNFFPGRRRRLRRRCSRLCGRSDGRARIRRKSLYCRPALR